jgi:hypothetical protein
MMEIWNCETFDSPTFEMFSTNKNLGNNASKYVSFVNDSKLYKFCVTDKKSKVMLTITYEENLLPITKNLYFDTEAAARIKCYKLLVTNKILTSAYIQQYDFGTDPKFQVILEKPDQLQI